MDAAVKTGDVVKDLQLGHERFQPRCPKPGKKNKKKNQLTTIPHPLWCNRFYVCDHGTAIEQSCNTGTIWNDQIKRCEYSRVTPPHCVMATWGLNDV
jgi:Chitin binding Peritrophin-A domain